MARHISTYPGTLVMPDGIEVKHGGDVPVTADLAKNQGVAEWIASGWLVSVTPVVMPSAKK